MRLTDGSDPVEPQLSILNRLMGVADAMIEQVVPDAPEAIQDELTIRFAGYLYDQPSAGRGDSYGNAWRNSGAASLASRWIERRASAQAEAGPGTTPIGVDEAAVLEILEAWALEQSAYHFYSRYSLTDPAIAVATDIPAAATGGYVLPLIPATTVSAGIAANEDFVAEWLGTLEIDLDYDSGNNKRIDFEMHFKHTLRVGGVPLSFDAVRTVHYRVNRQTVFTLPLNIFNSRSRVPLGEFQLRDGTTIMITQDDLDDDFEIQAELRIKSAGDDGEIESLNIERGQVTFYQLAAIGRGGVAGDKGATGDPGDKGRNRRSRRQGCNRR